MIYNKRPNDRCKRAVIPLLFSTSLAECYEDLKQVLELIGYERHKWMIVSDLKIINCIMGLKPGWCKFHCIYCLWDTRFKRADQQYHYDKRHDLRTSYAVNGDQSIEKPPLVPVDRIWLPPLHVKLGCFQQFIKSLAPGSSQNGNIEAIEFLVEKFKSTKTRAKVLSGTFDGPDLRKLVFKFGGEFRSKLSENEKRCWDCLCDLWVNFFGNHRSDDYRMKIDNLINAFRTNSINVSTKIHYLIHHLDHFPPNCGFLGEEKGENLHQEFKIFVRRFKTNLVGLVAHYLWSKKIEDPALVEQVRKIRNSNFHMY